MSILEFKNKVTAELLVSDANKNLDEAFSRWKRESYRDYDPMLAWLIDKGVSEGDAEGIFRITFMAGFDSRC